MEMYLFLGIIIALGVHVLPSVADYWSTDSLLGVPGISAVMPIDRFKALLSCLHLNDNSKAVPRNQTGHDHLHFDTLGEHSTREQSIDEAKVDFKGRIAMKQYVPMKPTKRGFKVWCHCCPNGITKGPLNKQGRQTSALL